MVPVFTPPPPPPQNQTHYLLERPFKHYEVSMNAPHDHQEPVAADSAAWATHPWYWQGDSPPLFYPEGDVDVKSALGDSCAYTSDTSLSSEDLQRADYFSYRRDSTSSISSLSSTTSSHSNYEEKLSEQPSTRASTRRHSSGSGRPHECGFCTRTFARRHDLERHTRVHTGVKPYVCPCCLKAFPRSDARGRHFRNEPGCRAGPQMLAFIKKSIRSTI